MKRSEGLLATMVMHAVNNFTVAIAIKPTSSIRIARRSIDKAGAPAMVETHGRHDPCVGLRAAPIAEAMLALVLIDHALRHLGQNSGVAVDTPVIAGPRWASDPVA